MEQATITIAPKANKSMQKMCDFVQTSAGLYIIYIFCLPLTFFLQFFIIYIFYLFPYAFVVANMWSLFKTQPFKLFSR